MNIYTCGPIYVTGNLCNQAFRVMPVAASHFAYCLKFPQSFHEMIKIQGLLLHRLTDW